MSKISIFLMQTSPESAETFVLFQKLFKGQSCDELKKTALDCGFSEDEFQVSLITKNNFRYYCLDS